MINAKNHIDLKIFGTEELREIFSDLRPAVQNRIVLNGMKDAAKIILAQAKSNFKSKQKNKSVTGYKNFNKSFTTEPTKSVFGLRVGIKNYKYKWVEWGTDERSYKKGVKKSLWKKTSDKSDGHKTGKIQPTNFFFDAVKDRKQEAENNVSNAILKSLEKTISKYQNANHK